VPAISKSTVKPMNKLVHETSPYLLQHAGNPVNWFPWGSDALQLARAEKKPILLSIGYAACHWCHVMAHESFEDMTVAQRMNELFVNIKVDREERPDLDKVYQQAYQLLARKGGGWPLTVFLDPDTLLPFYCGTYFPPAARYGLPGFYDVLAKVAEYFDTQQGTLARNGHALQQALNVAEPPLAAEKLQAVLLDRSRETALAHFDGVNGGFGGAPKFPHPTLIDFLLAYWLQRGGQDTELAAAIRKTLDAMADGGIYDHLGGGFCRYSVDAEWNIPHFEKMLYDNGALLSVYARAALVFADNVYYQRVHETASWVMREMQAPEGGYYASLDADSDGEEGLYYIWNRAEPRQLLDESEYRLFALHYGLDQTPGFEGRWHLRVTVPLQVAAASCGVNLPEAVEMLERGKAKLLRFRERRVRPALDTKILTAWNALTISGMAAAGRACQRPDYMASAARAFDFIRSVSGPGGDLYATATGGIARFSGYLDDYAFLLEAGLELLQARWCSMRFEWLIQLADALLAKFEDKEAGGFYFTAHDQEQLINRCKPWMDEAMVSGNAAAATALFKLGHVLGEPRYLEAAGRTVAGMPDEVQYAPDRYAGMMAALDLWLFPPQTIIIRGHAQEDVDRWAARIYGKYRPDRICFAIAGDDNDLPVCLGHFRSSANTIAYVCRGVECRAPLTDLDELDNFLSSIDDRTVPR
jgi:uncharacterized protein YyaL (SSP411 family)